MNRRPLKRFWYIDLPKFIVRVEATSTAAVGERINRYDRFVEVSGDRVEDQLSHLLLFISSTVNDDAEGEKENNRL